jgi:hypothetical protein
MPIEFAEYDQLYETLGEWATYAMEPAAYGDAKLRAFLGVAPVRARE